MKIKGLKYILLLSVFSLSSCGELANGEVKKITKLGYITGYNGYTNTKEAWALGGSDLGIPVYDEANNKMYFLFGDSYSGASEDGKIRREGWRSNVIGVTTDFDASDGITFDYFINNGRSYAVECLKGAHLADNNTNEVSKIPTGGIVIDDTFYIRYMSVRTWSDPNNVYSGSYWEVCYNGTAKSTDQGQTWEYIDGLYWCDTPDEYSANIYNYTFNRTPSAEELAEHTAENMLQIYSKDGKDGYIYNYGISGGRYSKATMMRVKKENFEIWDEYEYYLGLDSNNSPIWEKGKKGLESYRASENKYIAGNSIAEPHVVYNAYLNKWMFTFKNYDKPIAFRMKLADNPWGPWNTENIDFMPTVDKKGNLLFGYGGFTHEKYQVNNGKIQYYISSDWSVYNSYIVKVEFK